MEELILKDKKICECGKCNQEVSGYYWNSKKHCWYKKRFIHGHNPHTCKFPRGHNIGHRFKKGENLGDKHPMWKGGRLTDRDGYILIYSPNHPHCECKGYVREHRLIMEKYLGRYLDPKEVVHHINGNESDNRIENLELISNQSEHASYHSNKRWRNI